VRQQTIAGTCATVWCRYHLAQVAQLQRGAERLAQLVFQLLRQQPHGRACGARGEHLAPIAQDHHEVELPLQLRRRHNPATRQIKATALTS
jgi:hypothetical protein